MESEVQPNTPPATPLSQVPVSLTTNWKKIFLFILLGMVVITVSVFIGIQIGRNQITDQSTTSLTETAANPTALPSASNPTADPTANWKTYTETREVKFSIKYPSTWIIDTKDGMYGEKGARFDSGKEAIGSVGIGWNSQPVEPNCNTGTEKKELVQIKNRKIEMCHSTGSTQEPEGFSYNSSTNGVNYSVVTSNYPGEKNRQIILDILSTLDI